MALTSGFYNSQNGDRKYNAEQLSAIFDGVINDGVFQSIDERFLVRAVAANPLQVSVGTGRAWFNSTWIYNDSRFILNLSNADTLRHRIDTVVLEIDRSVSARRARVIIVEGTPATTNPQPAALTRSLLLNQYPLARVYRAAGSSGITQANITNMVGQSPCPFITGILETADITDMFSTWETQFTEWFDTVQAVLTSDPTGQLLVLITALQTRATNLESRATTLENKTSNVDNTRDTSKNVNGATYARNHNAGTMALKNIQGVTADPGVNSTLDNGSIILVYE